ncbi:outer membrane receptor protein involved in Fe transport [Caulobacter ginsengisoli]|uniref:Outer membrane receptor protein involved in Fe transport n=1 Tax=Caulobacter ginsengisoli TaxID=400775 RepID=A0ABU0IW92_9CAUL|nr:hypothetical protein [Caulobacter ginsengisoli]MDQ0466281.1 outer membrane receptor protein involved in Fe transport [Caulobacter ginsengisoli]
MRTALIATLAALALTACVPKVETEGGAAATAAAAALPAYAPAYPGATIVTASKTTVGGVQAVGVSFATTDTPEQVVAFYKGKLGASGLGPVKEMNLGMGQMLVVQDAATGKSVQVMAMKAGDQTSIQVTQSSAKPES